MEMLIEDMDVTPLDAQETQLGENGDKLDEATNVPFHVEPAHSFLQRFTSGKLLQDFLQVLQSFSMETFFSGEDIGVWTLKRIYKSILIH